MSKDIYYSDKYEDDKFEYRHVMLPKVQQFLWFLLKDFFLNYLYPGAGEAGAEDAHDVGGGVEEPGGAAEPGLGALHAARARAPHPPLQVLKLPLHPVHNVWCSRTGFYLKYRIPP